jgi:hypothetical protein
MSRPEKEEYTEYYRNLYLKKNFKSRQDNPCPYFVTSVTLKEMAVLLNDHLKGYVIQRKLITSDILSPTEDQ